MRKILALLALFFFLPFLPSVHAAETFRTNYNVTYSINNKADTHVNIKVEIINLTENYYTPSNTITLGFKDIRNLAAGDEIGPITPKLTTSEEGNTVEVVFNQKTVGLDKKINFNISFDTSEVANHLGSVWDINIPGISKQNNFSEFNVTVVYPNNLGRPTFIKPYIENALGGVKDNSISFSKNQLGSSGISMSFGENQSYDFNLSYHLENSNVFPIKTELALPPTTNYQDVYIGSILPKPENVYIDKNGNWLAQYKLKPSEKLNVKVLGQAKVYLNPRQEFITVEMQKEYLKSQTFWEKDNAKIKELAKSLETPDKIYEYVVGALNYDFSRVETNSPRLGAVKTLQNPSSAVCLEFSDLFIAIARAAGIPTRQLNGFAYTDSKQRPLSLVKDVLHAWPEYYDFNKNTWIMVDPTWENTTHGVDYFNMLDFDHFTFVINGDNSSYPVPAGGYKFSNNQDSKDVSVSIADSVIEKSSAISTNIDIKNTFTSGLPIAGSVKIENNGGAVSNFENLFVYSDTLNPGSQTFNVAKIPPYGHLDMTIKFDSTGFLTKTDAAITIVLGENTFNRNVTILPFFLNKWLLLGGLIFVSFFIAISAAYAGYRSISFFRQRR